MDAAQAGQFVVVILSPTILVGTGLILPRAIRAVRRRVKQRRGDDIGQPVHAPIEQLAADLRRLLQRHETLKHSSGVAMRAQHLRAIEAAIGDCAIEAAQALGVSRPERADSGPLPTPELRRLLRALADAGLVLVPASGLLAADGYG